MDEHQTPLLRQHEQRALLLRVGREQGVQKDCDFHEDGGNGWNLRVPSLEIAQNLRKASSLIPRLFGSKRHGRGNRFGKV